MVFTKYTSRLRSHEGSLYLSDCFHFYWSNKCYLERRIDLLKMPDVHTTALLFGSL
jgi:hypothetical protein